MLLLKTFTCTSTHPKNIHRVIDEFNKWIKIREYVIKDTLQSISYNNTNEYTFVLTAIYET